MAQQTSNHPQYQPRETVAQRRSPSNNEGALRFRLDADPVLKRLQVFLLGLMERRYEDPESGEIRTQLVQIGEAKVNDVGYQSIMFQVESVVNSQTVQGNLRDDQYITFVADFHEEFYNDLWVNSRKYGIRDDDFNGVVAAVTNFVRLFTTRPIANKERESYNDTVSEHQTVVAGASRGWKKWVPGL